MRSINPFALPHSYDDYNVKTFTRQVKTKKWCNTYVKYLGKYADRFTTSGVDKKQVVGGLLHCAYGVNIGEQVLSNLNAKDLDKIKENVLAVCYG